MAKTKNTIVLNKKTYDKDLIEAAKKAVAGRGDGRVSKDDAVIIMDLLKRDGIYSDLERATIAFIRRTYKWTPAADDWFGAELKRWALEQKKN